MSLKDKHIAILVDNYFEQPEFEEPISAFKDAGAEVTVIASDKLNLQALKHVKFGDKYQADILLNQASSYDYDALVLPGGAMNADSLRTNLAAQEWLLEFLDSGKPVAAICHAPWLLVSAESVEGRRLTSYHTIKDDIANAGGEWVNLPVVVDDNLITSRSPDDLPYFNNQIIAMLSIKGSEVKEDTESHFKTSSYGYFRAADEPLDKDQDDILSDMGAYRLDEDSLYPSSIIPGEQED